MSVSSSDEAQTAHLHVYTYPPPYPGVTDNLHIPKFQSLDPLSPNSARYQTPKLTTLQTKQVKLPPEPLISSSILARETGTQII